MIRFKKVVLTFTFLLFISHLNAKDSITVYIFMLDECRICQELAPELNNIYNTFHSEDIGFLGLFPNFSSKPKGIESFKKKYKIAFETKTDYFKKLCHKFEATILPEVIVYNETQKFILYRGLVNDLFYAPGKRRHAAQNHFLKDALTSINHNAPIKVKETLPIGCFINFNDSLFEN